MTKFKYIFFLLSFSILNSQFLISQTSWNVPHEKKTIVAPFKFDANTIKKGEQLFNKNCMSCHGVPGKGPTIKMVPVPVDPVSKEYQANSDGDIFYKMTEGRGPMPSFKNIIPENDRWLIISYVRSFNKAYIQPASVKSEGGKVEKNIKLNLNFNKKNNSLIVNVVKTSSANAQNSLAGYNITVFAKRYFGLLKISDSKTTDNSGNVAFDFPKDLPGDKDGNISLKILADNEISALNISKDSILKISIPANQIKLLDTRAWWNVRSKAPIWLILAYSLSVLTAIGFILYIISLLFKIWKAGASANV